MADIVLVEDEDVLRRYLGGTLEKLGHTVRGAETAEDGLAFIEEGEPDILLTDHRLPGMSGHELLLATRKAHPGVAVILLTAHGTIQDAVEAMRAGASDYLNKPINRDELSFVIDRCLDDANRRAELEYYRRRDLAESAAHGIVGESHAIRMLRVMVGRLASHEKKGGGGPTILLTGETGTGKGLVARALHNASPRKELPFLEVNCAALPDNLLEAELMGYERGAFTGATQAKPGLFEAAEAGTIFLDEIARMSMGLQAKLLKVIDERSLRRLGSTRDRAMRCSVITASHTDLGELVARGEFLEDLFHRINVFRLECPPLRERGDDVLMLAHHFMERHGADYGVPVPKLSPGAQQVLRDYHWPGNIRELAHVMERAVVLAEEDQIPAEDIQFFTSPRRGADGAAAGGGAVTAQGPLTLAVDFSQGAVSLEEIEQRLIREAWKHTNGNRVQTANLLGISRDTLRYRMEKFAIG
jgi:two-component system response regulator AtoC